MNSPQSTSQIVVDGKPVQDETGSHPEDIRVRGFTPRRTASLAEMLTVYAPQWNEIMRLLDSFDYVRPQAITRLLDEPVEHLLKDLRSLRTACVSLNLKYSEMLAGRMIADLENGTLGPVTAKIGDSIVLNPQGFQEHIRILRERVDDELQLVTFLFVDYSHHQYVNDLGQFGPQVNREFPGATLEITEAFKCFGLERYTACVFHLMRVLDIGLSSLAVRFNVDHEHRNWENIIRDIHKAIADMHQNPEWNQFVNWRDHREFYSQVLNHIDLDKMAWRNYTMHTRGMFSEDEAKMMMENVRAFMVRLSQPPAKTVHA